MGWISGWSHRKIVTITGQSGAGTDYQVNLSIGDASGGDFHLENHCASFPNDITVTDNDQTTLLDHWVEDLTVDPISMWVEVADDLGSNADVCVYYTKSGESSASSVANTFVLGDNFESYTVGALGTQGSWVTDDACIKVQTSKVKEGTKAIDGDCVDMPYHAQHSITQSANGGYKCWVAAATTNNARPEIRVQEGATDIVRVHFLSDATIRHWSGAAWINIQSFTANQFYDIEIVWHSDNKYDVWVDGTKKVTDAACPNNMVSGADTISMHVKHDSAADHGYFDLVRVRKYLSPIEPAFSSAGSEESAGGRLVYGGLVNAGLVGGRLA